MVLWPAIGREVTAKIHTLCRETLRGIRCGVSTQSYLTTPTHLVKGNCCPPPCISDFDTCCAHPLLFSKVISQEMPTAAVAVLIAPRIPSPTRPVQRHTPEFPNHNCRRLRSGLEHRLISTSAIPRVRYIAVATGITAKAMPACSIHVLKLAAFSTTRGFHVGPTLRTSPKLCRK